MTNEAKGICNRCGDILTQTDRIETGIWKDIQLCDTCRKDWVKESIAIENGEPYTPIRKKHKQRPQNIFIGIQVNEHRREPGERVSKYPIEFDEEFKERIREQFNRKCFLCDCTEAEDGKRLAVHHIDYNKDNMDEDNFIPCCRRCHGKTTGNREYWQDTITEKLLLG